MPVIWGICCLRVQVIRLPMSFYDSQPTGRLLNRLTKDTESVDIQVGDVKPVIRYIRRQLI